jgi:hypothetical protein
MNSTVMPASVFVTSAYSDPQPIEDFLRTVKKCPLIRYKLVENPASADIILFVENSHYHADRYFKRLKNHPLVQQYPNKVFMYNPHDTPWMVLPGLYPSMPKNRFDKRVMATSAFIEIHNTYIQCDFSRTPRLLYSFRGMPYTRARKKVLQLKHPRGESMAFAANIYGHGSAIKEPQVQYAELLLDSKFVLCPKGIGTSTSRIYEVMEAGRVPVIIADQWVPPSGLNWNEFAVFVSENDVKNIPQILEGIEPDWEKMARRAREVWEYNFAPGVIFNYMIENILSLENLSTYSMEMPLAFAHYGAKVNFRFRLFRHQVKTTLQKIVKI